jgi:2-oxoglutarate ferredoxin oxidoreductase subunit beta
MKIDKLSTKNESTWCPGCPNFMILEAVKKSINNPKNYAIVAGIGCHGKMYDHLNLSGIYGLHGRPIPTALGIKLGNPNLKVIAFGGDGDTYSEGMSHFIHAFRYNVDMTLIVHNNQSFSLTTGQSTPTTQQGYINGDSPKGEINTPLNPIKLALASGATFVARANAMDLNHTTSIIKKAIKHKGFSYVEIMQKCLIFNKDMNELDKIMYKIPDNKNLSNANKYADQWNYNSKKGKMPLGIIYQTREPTLFEKMKI